MRRAPLALLALAALAGCGGDDLPAFRQAPDKAAGPALPAEAGRSHRFGVRLRTEALGPATAVAVRPGDDEHVYVAEQAGQVRRVTRAGTVRRRPFLDVGAHTRTGGELGLLGLAFHPDGSRAYLHFTTRATDTRVVEVDLATRRERVLLRVDQPEDYENHKGGQLAFGPDGALYLALGDGGSAFDPGNRSQDPDLPFGKILRFDGRSWRAVALGLRNPWRFAFDPHNGRLWIADVGQDRIEEVNAVDLDPGGPPPNFGWAAYEGPLPVGAKPLGETGRLTWPVAGFDHDTGCSITGGVVPRASRIAALRDRYLFADFCRGIVWSMNADEPFSAPDVRRERARLPQVTAFGTGPDGEPLAVTAGGRLYDLVAAR
jgi:glucose/arabinose dehydrogenase